MAAVTTARPELSRDATSRRRARGSLGRLAIYLALAALAFFYLYPFFWILASSLKTRGEFFAEPMSLLPSTPIWQNYVDAWNKARFGRYFFNSVLIAVLVVAFVNLFTAMGGYALARTSFPGKRLILGAILVTMFIPAGYTIIPTYDLVRTLRLNNTIWAVVAVQTAGFLIFNTFLYTGYFTTLPQELEDAARIDGANMPLMFWHIMLPLARPMTATVTLLCFIWSWNEFFLPLIFTINAPELRTLAVGMYAFTGENTRDWTAMCAGTIITLVPIVIVFLSLQRYFVNGIAGAVK